MTTATDPRIDPTRVIRAPRGTALHCKNWIAEAAYRMLQNNLDPAVAEHPDNLVVYGGTGKAARSWPALEVILADELAGRPWAEAGAGPLADRSHLLVLVDAQGERELPRASKLSLARELVAEIARRLP